MSARFFSAFSRHPVAAHAAGELAGTLLEASEGRRPSLILLFATSGYGGALDDIAHAVDAILNPEITAALVAEGVIANRTEVQRDSAIVAWACFDVMCDARLLSDSLLMADDVDLSCPFIPQTAVLVADPFSFSPQAVFDAFATQHPGVAVHGGYASSGRGPGGNRLLLNDRSVSSGALLLLFEQRATSVVSQGTRPIGTPYTVTRTDRNAIVEMGGVSAITKLETLLSNAEPEEKEILAQGLLLGRVIGTKNMDYESNDFLARSMVGFDRGRGSIEVNYAVEIGDTVQFLVRDAVTADLELRQQLLEADVASSGALLFAGNARGSTLFDQLDHDAILVDDYAGSPALAGFFSAGEFGPIHGANYVLSETASLALW